MCSWQPNRECFDYGDTVIDTVITKFQSLVSDMSCGDNAKCKRIGAHLPHVFASSSQNEDHVEKRSSVNILPKMLILFRMSALIQLTLMSLFAKTKCIRLIKTVLFETVFVTVT